MRFRCLTLRLKFVFRLHLLARDLVYRLSTTVVSYLLFVMLCGVFRLSYLPALMCLKLMRRALHQVFQLRLDELAALGVST